MSTLVAPIFGNLNLSVDTVISSTADETVIDAACTGTSGSLSLSATNASFSSYHGYPIFIHQTRGTNAGLYMERNVLVSYSAGVITLGLPLSFNYTSGAQILVIIPQKSFIVNSGVVYSVKAYDGTTGGIMYKMGSGRFVNLGTINAKARGFRAIRSTGDGASGYQGEGSGGPASISSAANGNGGGGGPGSGGGDPGGSSGGTGGSHATAATAGAAGASHSAPAGGVAVGSADMTSGIFMGGAGGQGGPRGTFHDNLGGFGGAIVILDFWDIDNSAGIIDLDGGDAEDPIGNGDAGTGGGGAAGALWGRGKKIIPGTISCRGGIAGTKGGGNGGLGTPGSDGRVRLEAGTIDTTGEAVDIGTGTYSKKIGGSSWLGSVGRG